MFENYKVGQIVYSGKIMCRYRIDHISSFYMVLEFVEDDPDILHSYVSLPPYILMKDETEFRRGFYLNENDVKERLENKILQQKHSVEYAKRELEKYEKELERFNKGGK